MKLTRSQPTTPAITTVQTRVEMTAPTGCDRQERTALMLPAIQAAVVRD
jgi:hypothetical protein